CNQQALTPALFHEALGLIGVLLFFEINNHHVRAFFRERNRDRATDAALAAGYERHFIFQFSAAALLLATSFRPGLHFMFSARALLLMLGWLKFPFPRHKEFARCSIREISLSKRRLNLHRSLIFLRLIHGSSNVGVFLFSRLFLGRQSAIAQSVGLPRASRVVT